MARGYEPQHHLRRARDQRQHHDREADASRPAVLRVPVHEQPEDEDADDDRGQPVQEVDGELDRRPHGRRCELLQEDGDQDAEREGDRGRNADEDRRADDQWRNSPTRLAEEGQILRQEAPRELAAAALGHRPDDDAEEEDGGQGRDRCASLGQAVDDPAAARARVAPEHRPRLDGGHQLPPVGSTWKRRTITWASRFVTSPITSRIAAR